MAEMYDHHTCSSPPPPPPAPSAPPPPPRPRPYPSLVESDEISLLLHHLLHSSSSPCMSVSDRPKQMPFSSPAPLPPPLFSSSSQITSTARFFDSLPVSHLRPCGSALVSNSDCRVRDGSSTAESSAAVDSSSLILSSSAHNLKEAASTTTSAGAGGDRDAGVTASLKRRKVLMENDLDDYDCDSEEGLEAPEAPSKPGPHRSSSKRSRAAEVHNLSEKRRRSRINEKMKALQNLIPNSNKTDKASMLDEAIEYLKQLQLQVQMLSMRNGLSLHPMYLPGVLQSIQLPQMQMGFEDGERPLHMTMGTGTLPVNDEALTQTAFCLSSQQPTLQKPAVLPSVTNITDSETSFGMELPIQTHHGPFQLSTASEEFYREGLLPQQRLDMRHSARNSSENKEPMTTTTLPFDAQGSVLLEPNSLEARILQREGLQEVLPNLQPGRGVSDEIKTTPDY